MKNIVDRAFKKLREIKSVAFSTVDDGDPMVRIADVMLEDQDGLYFLTARGKPFYQQLINEKKVAICGMDKNYVMVRIAGDIRECIGREVIDKIFEKNLRMNDLYPGEKRGILEAFHLYRGKGEIFDLSVETVVRERFSFGGDSVNSPGYLITDKCTGCGLCFEACPIQVILEGEVYLIKQNNCLECGSCLEVCPEDAIEPSKGM